MEESASGQKTKASPPSDLNPTVGRASEHLTNLPSRGLFSSTVLSSNQGGIQIYICDHDTSPPEEQMIKTNQTNILIRSLTLQKQKSDSSSKVVKGKASAENAKAKRAAERPVDGRGSIKRPKITFRSRGPQQGGSSSRTSENSFQGLTVERLRAILRERGLPTRGKKEELIARLNVVGSRVKGQA